MLKKRIKNSHNKKIVLPGIKISPVEEKIIFFTTANRWIAYSIQPKYIILF